MKRILNFLLRALGGALFGFVLVGGVLYGRYLHSGPELKVWHRAPLDEEFTVARGDDVRTLADYFALEKRLFDELDREVYAHIKAEDQVSYIRYAPGSKSDPHRWARDWNRSFELGPTDDAVGTALLLHGLTDSPYSMRSIGLHLASRGYHVVGLRLPGHGTAPAGLLRFTIEDMRAAVALAVRDLERRMPASKPLLLVGYSNGAALAVDYALRQRADPQTGLRPSGLVLISPSIAISRFAVLARIRTGLSSVPGFERAAWQLIELEFDPFKYSSFSFNAAGQVQRLTSGLSRDVARLAESRGLDDFPPVLAFISAVDSTVHVDAVVDALLGHLAPNGHELVLFDINRSANVQPLLVKDPGPLTARLLAMPTRPFALTVITNVNPDTMQVHEIRSVAGAGVPTIRSLDLAWPDDVSSLSHVSLTFPPDDPLYGSDPVGEDGTLRLGRVEVRGENGVLAIPPWVLMRQRSNPFYSYLTGRLDEFLGRAQQSSDPAAGSTADPAAAVAPEPAGTRPGT